MPTTIGPCTPAQARQINADFADTVELLAADDRLFDFDQLKYWRHPLRGVAKVGQVALIYRSEADSVGRGFHVVRVTSVKPFPGADDVVRVSNGRFTWRLSEPAVLARTEARIAPSTAPAADRLPVGARVSAQWTNGKWYDATIIAVRDGGVYNVQWDQGGKRSRVALVVPLTPGSRGQAGRCGGARPPQNLT